MSRRPGLLGSYYLYQAAASCVFFWPMFYVYYEERVGLGVATILWQPLLNVYMNRLVDSRLRATMLSAQSLVARLALAGAIALLGVGTARAGLSATLAAAALAAAVAGLVLAVTGPTARLPGDRRVIAGGACPSVA